MFVMAICMGWIESPHCLHRDVDSTLCPGCSPSHSLFLKGMQLVFRPIIDFGVRCVSELKLELLLSKCRANLRKTLLILSLLLHGVKPTFML